MTLIFTEGCEYGGDVATTTYGKWQAAQNNSAYSTSAARTGSRGILLNSNHYIQKYLLPDQAYHTMIIGFAAYRQSTSTMAFYFRENQGTYIHAWLSIANDGSLTCFRLDSTSAITLPPNTIQVNRWHYIEFKVFVDNSAGYIEIYVDGLLKGTATGIDTRNNTASYGYVDTLYFLGNTSFYIDDIYLVKCDSTTPNSYLGDVKIYNIVPTGVGSYTQWAPNTAVANWTTVDEAAPNTTDYNTISGVGKHDSYAFGDIAASISGQVVAVMANMYSWNTGSYRVVLAPTNTLAGGTQIGSGYAQSNSAGFYQSPFIQTPASGSWTVDNVNNSEFGVVITQQAG